MLCFELQSLAILDKPTLYSLGLRVDGSPFRVDQNSDAADQDGGVGDGEADDGDELPKNSTHNFIIWFISSLYNKKINNIRMWNVSIL